MTLIGGVFRAFLIGYQAGKSSKSRAAFFFKVVEPCYMQPLRSALVYGFWLARDGIWCHLRLKVGRFARRFKATT